MQDIGVPPSHRLTAGEHHRVDTALFQRVQAIIASLQDAQHLLPQVPADIQGRMVEPLTSLHAELNGLLFTAYLLASVHPNADDFDIS